MQRTYRTSFSALKIEQATFITEIIERDAQQHTLRRQPMPSARWLEAHTPKRVRQDQRNRILEHKSEQEDNS